MKRFLLPSVLFAVSVLVQALPAATAPATILHVVTVKWKADASVKQQQSAIDGIAAMVAAVPGVKSYWVKKLKVQPADYSTVFAIEFESKAAFDAYTSHPAHAAWEKTYLPLREESHTVDVSN